MSRQLMFPVLLMKASPKICHPKHQDTLLIPKGAHIIGVALDTCVYSEGLTAACVQSICIWPC